MGMNAYWKQKKTVGEFKERAIEIAQSKEKTKNTGKK